MDIDPSEARATLEAAKSAQREIRSSLHAWGAGYHLVIWGVMCILCFGATHYYARLPRFLVPLLWIILEAAATAGSNIVALRMRRRVSNPADSRVALLWVVFAAFGAAIGLLLHPGDGRDISAYAVLMTALWMAVMGLWLDLALLWMGVAIACLTLAGATLLREWYYLWMSLGVGGAMTIAGAFLAAKGARRARDR